MQILIKRFDTTLPLPEYKTAGAAALDLIARTSVTIESHQVGYVPMNIALQLPPDCFVIMAARSSLHKRGVMMANGIGIGDSDFCGNEDEYQAALFNFTSQPVTIERGERITQLLIMTKLPVELHEVAELTGSNRGGFGSTGRK